MSSVTLTKWGNSYGIRIPSSIIKEAQLYPGEEFEVQSDNHGRLVLTPKKNLQEAWLEQFNTVADLQGGEDPLNITNDFDKDEWTW